MISTVTRLRILHLSDSGLPDWRVEKSATTALNVGHKVFFGGYKKSTNYDRNIFSGIYEINWSERARRGIPFYWHYVKKQVERVIKEVRPDIVHAHDLFAAKMISQFTVPFIYDDHEYWSEYAKILHETSSIVVSRLGGKLPRKFLRRKARELLNRNSVRLWTRWEKEIVSNNPTITVSDTIAEELRTISNNTKDVFVVPNYPMRSEIQDFKKPEFHDKLSSVYAGLSGKGETTPAHTNIDGLVEAFADNDIGNLTIIGWSKNSGEKVKYAGFLPRKSMYEEMFKHSIGLLPWKKHWSHVFVNPNKIYEYANAGLFVMCTSSFKPVPATLKEHCATFEDYEDMISQLEYFNHNLQELYTKRLKLFDYARDNLIWEKYEKNILRAYQLC